MNSINWSKKIFVALDTVDLSRATEIVLKLKDNIGGVKIGKEFFTAFGPVGVKTISEMGVPIFLDLKWHDIPHTVAGAVRASLALRPAMINVHASGGAKMIRAAADAADKAGNERPLVLAVTILTSLDKRDLNDIGFDQDLELQVLRLAGLAKENGADGVVCSPHEVQAIRSMLGPEFKLVVPGIRPSWANSNDQKRFTSPKEAIEHGADYLVIGRPITESRVPLTMVNRITQELSER